ELHERLEHAAVTSCSPSSAARARRRSLRRPAGAVPALSSTTHHIATPSSGGGRALPAGAPSISRAGPPSRMWKPVRYHPSLPRGSGGQGDERQVKPKARLETAPVRSD